MTGTPWRELDLPEVIGFIEYLGDRVEEGSLLTVLQAVQARLEAWCAVALAEVRVADT